MKIDKSLLDDYAILTLKGEFDTFYCMRFQEEIEALIAQGISHIILNMRMVKFINSTALGAIIKAHKRCQAESGVLVVSHPSQFVQRVVSSLGIDQLVPMFDDEDAAVRHVVQSLNARELAWDAPVEEEKVLISFPDDTRNRQIGGRQTLLGKMCNVDGQRLQFSWSGQRDGISRDQAKQLFYVGGEVRLKFQVKLFKKGYFETRAEVTETTPAEDQHVRVTARYKDMPKADQEALSQFASDMAFLKRELPS